LLLEREERNLELPGFKKGEKVLKIKNSVCKYALLTAQREGGSASLTLPGWCLKVWEWTTVVTN